MISAGDPLLLRPTTIRRSKRAFRMPSLPRILRAPVGRGMGAVAYITIRRGRRRTPLLARRPFPHSTRLCPVRHGVERDGSPRVCCISPLLQWRALPATLHRDGWCKREGDGGARVWKERPRVRLVPASQSKIEQCGQGLNTSLSTAALPARSERHPVAGSRALACADNRSSAPSVKTKAGGRRSSRRSRCCRARLDGASRTGGSSRPMPCRARRCAPALLGARSADLSDSHHLDVGNRIRSPPGGVTGTAQRPASVSSESRRHNRHDATDRAALRIGTAIRRPLFLAPTRGPLARLDSARSRQHAAELRGDPHGTNDHSD